MIQNQLSALLDHAGKIYNLENNPTKKVKKMGKPNADKLEFWAKEEYYSRSEGAGAIWHLL